MKKKAVSLILALALCLGMIPAAFAADAQPVSSNNKNMQDYTTYGSTVKSYLYENPSGGLTRVEYVKNQVVIEDYDSSFQLQSSRTITPELPIWGGFFAGAEYNFLVFGQSNASENNNTEVIRVVKYDKNWNRLGQASLKGANTVTPFDAGSLRCDEYGGYLYIRTCHKMYRSSDGLNHQSNLTMAVKQSDMTITDSYYDVMNNAYGYVSHSFNEFIIVDEDGKIVCIDHGDAYPRGVAFTKYYADAGTGRFRGAGYSAWCSYKNMKEFAGSVGANITGASIGGLAETTNCYIFCYNYDGKGGSGDRYVFFHYMDKATGTSWSAQITTTPGSTTPVLAPTGLAGGYMLWNGKSGNTVNDTLYYLHYGEDGKPEQYQTATGSLSDCQPIYYNGKVVWYTTSNSAPIFYALDSSGVKATPVGAAAAPTAQADPAAPSPAPTPADPAPAPTASATPAAPSTQTAIMSNSNITYSNDSSGAYISSDGTATIDGVKMPGGNYCALALESGLYTWYLLREDGTLWSANCHDIWELEGKNGTVSITKVMDDVVQIQPGMALKKDGTLWTNYNISDVYSSDGGSWYRSMEGVKQISTVPVSMALKNDGTLWTWGSGSGGYGTANPALGWKVSDPLEWYGPTKIMDNVAYATGTMAIKTDGTLWSWGSNSGGLVGNGSAYDQYTPVKVLDNVVGAWHAVNGAWRSNYAMTKDGTVYSWGDNPNGILGFEGGDQSQPASPFGTPAYSWQTTPHKSSLTNVVSIMGGGHAQKADGSVWTIGASGFKEKALDNIKVLSGWPSVSTSSAAPAAPDTPAAPAAPTTPSSSSASFSDVKSSDYFADAVQWAVNNNVTTGTTTTMFSPTQTCTAAQILTFLWRAAGEPKSSAQLPVALPASLSYADGAIRWAAEKGMVGRTFDPNAPCTRANAVTYIWQAFNSPAAGSSGFSDVPASAGYSQAVAWAVGLGVTDGTGGNRFSPDTVCNRGQIVTFLHRAYVPEARLGT